VISEPTIQDYIDAATEGRSRTGLDPIMIRVLELIAEGLTYQQIGSKIGMPGSTARWHASQMMRRLAARSQAHAVAIGFRRGILKRGQS
jgi:DNA-binding CsgD family transcriptional regulator